MRIQTEIRFEFDVTEPKTYVYFKWWLDYAYGYGTMNRKDEDKNRILGDICWVLLQWYRPFDNLMVCQKSHHECNISISNKV